jgi:hypothetical protein
VTLGADNCGHQQRGRGKPQCTTNEHGNLALDDAVDGCGGAKKSALHSALF